MVGPWISLICPILDVLVSSMHDEISLVYIYDISQEQKIISYNCFVWWQTWWQIIDISTSKWLQTKIFCELQRRISHRVLHFLYKIYLTARPVEKVMIFEDMLNIRQIYLLASTTYLRTPQILKLPHMKTKLI